MFPDDMDILSWYAYLRSSLMSIGSSLICCHSATGPWGRFCEIWQKLFKQSLRSKSPRDHRFAPPIQRSDLDIGAHGGQTLGNRCTDPSGVSWSLPRDSFILITLLVILPFFYSVAGRHQCLNVDTSRPISFIFYSTQASLPSYSTGMGRRDK